MGRGKSLSVGSATSRECMEETTCNRLQPRRHVGGKTQNTGKKQIKGPGRARNNRACPVCVLVKRMGIEGPEKGCASPECDSIPVSGARAQAGPPVSSRRRPQPSTARPYSPVDPVPPVPAGNASHAALHRSAPRGLPRLTSGGALDHREASVSVVSRSLFRDQARKRSRPVNSPARRTTKAGGSLAFPEERKPRAQRPVLGAMARLARTGGWVNRHLAVGGTQGPPVARNLLPIPGDPAFS